MTYRPDPTAAFPTALARTLALIAGIWIVSDLGFYFLLPALQREPSYNHDPIANATYYVFWIGVAVITFSHTYTTWRRYSRWHLFEKRGLSLVFWAGFFAVAITYTAYVLPSLPPFEWRTEWGPVPELPLAEPLYFLPKSFEIIFQQLLILALVLVLAAEGLSVRRISLACALLFGGMHLLLMFDQVPWSLVVRFVVVASLFGLVFPVLILRVQNGLAYSFAIHWGYYALTVFLARQVGPTTLLDAVARTFTGQ